MFDSILNLESAVGQLGDLSHAPLIKHDVSGDIILMCRKASEMRNVCYQSEEAYNQHSSEFGLLLNRFHETLGQSELFEFLFNHFGVYANGGCIRGEQASQIYEASCTILTETLSNAMACSEEVAVAITIARTGILMAISQEGSNIDMNLLQGFQSKSSLMQRKLSKHVPIKDILIEIRDACRKTIGYVPSDNPPGNGLPYRGNGTANILANAFYRVNFIPKETGLTALCLHTHKQADDVFRMQYGDQEAAKRTFASDHEKNKTEIDDLLQAFGTHYVVHM